MVSFNIAVSTIKRLYTRQGLSAREISEHFNVSIDAVYYLLRRTGISRRTAGEQNRLRFERSRPSFSVKKSLTILESKLLVAGVMLYWGEGAQWEGEKTVDFVNSQPRMIKVFVHFLRTICQVDESRMRVYLYCYDNQSVNKLIRFWSKVTDIPKKQFTKPYIKKASVLEKNYKMPWGLVHVRYSDKKLLLLLREWIKIIPQKLIKK